MIDPVIDPIERFTVCATLNALGAVEADVRREMKLSALQQRLQLSQNELLEQIAALKQAGYVSQFHEYGQETEWVMLTAKGKAAFEEHRDALRDS